MANRTVQFWGQGYSTPASGLSFTPCSITATMNGNTVFSGSIPTIEGTDIGRLPTDQQVLFTVELPMAFTGNASISIDITGDDVFFEQILLNYNPVDNPIYTQEQLAEIHSPTATNASRTAVYASVASPALTSEEIAILSAPGPYGSVANDILISHGIQTTVSSGPSAFDYLGGPEDARSNCVVTNATYYNPPPEPRPVGSEATWGWEIETAPGQTSNFSFDFYVNQGLE